MGEALCFEETAVGLEADVAQRRQVTQAFSDVEVLRIVDRRLRAQRLALLVVLLDTRPFIVDVQGRNNAIGDDAGSKASGSGFLYPSIKDQLHLLGATDVQVFADHILEEDPAAERAI